MTYTQKNSHFTKILLALTCILALAGGWFYYAHHFAQGVYAYDPKIDRAFIFDLFKNDWYYLISDLSSKDYSVAHMLDDRGSSRERSGDLIIKTYRVGGKPVGFVAYYPEELFKGRILFLAVDKAHRSKGYARKMLRYAVKDFKKQGFRVAELMTRSDNIPGQKLYASEGFKQLYNDGAYVKFQKSLE